MKTRRFQVFTVRPRHKVTYFEIQFDGSPVDWVAEQPTVRDCLDAVERAAKEGRISPAIADEAREHYTQVLGLSIDKPNGLAPLLDVGPCGALYTTFEGRRRRVYEGQSGLYTVVKGRHVYLTAPGGTC